MNAIITVVGNDKVGIIAGICIKLAEINVNVLDLSQTILQGSFTMVMAVDCSGSIEAVGYTFWDCGSIPGSDSGHGGFCGKNSGGNGIGKLRNPWNYSRAGSS